jgi:uncharacterized membrane protein YfhO
LDTPSSQGAPLTGEAPAPAKLTIAKYGDNSVVIDVETDRPGVLVLHDLFYPGWEARVDGVQKPVLRANILFRGVETTAGRHRIEFRFNPLSFANLAAAVSSVLHRNGD